MALGINFENEYLKKLRSNEERFVRKGNIQPSSQAFFAAAVILNASFLGALSSALHYGLVLEFPSHILMRINLRRRQLAALSQSHVIRNH